MDISSLVRAVIAAFDDAARLVARIRDQRKASDRALPEEPTRDLLDSLSLGPVLVRGHFDHDFKRFGEQYACGDIQARESMKDVLISLQMTLIIALRSSGMDDVDLDFDALQTASDDCRVNAGVCLGQLSQRLSDAAKAQAMYLPNQSMVYSNGPVLRAAPPVPSLAYSSSRSTHSSGHGPRTPPEQFSERFSTLSTSTIRPGTGKKSMTGSTGPGNQQPPTLQQPMPRLASDNFGRLPTQGESIDPDAEEALSIRRPSSHTLSPEDTELLSARRESPPPRNPARISILLQDPKRDSYVSSPSHSQDSSSPELSRVPSAQKSTSSRERYGSDDFSTVVEGQQATYRAGYDLDSADHSPPRPASYSTRAHETNHSPLERIRFLQQNSRPSRHGINHFPMPPSQGPPPRKSPPPLPSAQKRQESLNSSIQPTSPSPDPLSQFPQPRSSPLVPPVPPSQRQPPRLTILPVVSAPIPVHPSYAPPRGAPPPIPRVVTNYSNTSLPSTHSLAPGIHHLALPPSPTSIYSDQSLCPSQSNSVQNTTSLQPPSSLSRPATFHSTLPHHLPLTTIPLTLPTEKAPLGFCKSATRLFLSPTSDPKQNKSFSAASRPVGFNSMIPYWRCNKCYFEGPLCTIVNVDTSWMSEKEKKKKKKKLKGMEERIFDPKVRVSVGGGVRYKWIFLAKCHVHLKSHVDHVGGGRPAREGEVGGFGCLFCCVEGAGRGWTNLSFNNAFVSGALASNSSIRSGSSGHSHLTIGASVAEAKGTPIFGNVQSFMEHLEMHRREEWWPGAEMRERMKCVVGKVAGEGDEEWEVNFTPVVKGSGG